MHDLALARSIYSLYRIELNTYYIVLAKKQLSSYINSLQH